MSNKKYDLFLLLIGVVCSYATIRILFFFHQRPVGSDVLQGFLVGFGLAVITARITAMIKSKKVNGWITMFGCGEPDNGMLMRAACTLAFPGPVNIPQEAMYWTTSVDGANHDLSGKHCYVMRFPTGGLPPNSAFWSLTMGDAKNQFVANPINRYSLSDRSELVPNGDGSVDIYIQKTAPSGHESNWLPAPSGKFIVWLRVYMPDTVILDGKYTVPPVLKVK